MRNASPWQRSSLIRMGVGDAADGACVRCSRPLVAVETYWVRTRPERISCIDCWEQHGPLSDAPAEAVPRRD